MTPAIGVEEGPTELPSKHTDMRVRVVGGCLALGSLIGAASFAFHPPPASDLAGQMAIVAEANQVWMAVHWAAAAALSLFAIAGLVVLASGSRLTERWWTTTAWGVVTLGALWTIPTAVSEATVILDAAVTGDVATFEAWEMFAEAMATGFAFLALAVAVVAGTEARTSGHVTPTWAAYVGAVAGLAAFVGFAMGMGLGIDVGGLVWVAGTIVMLLWTLWFGVALLRLGPIVQTREDRSPA